MSNPIVVLYRTRPGQQPDAKEFACRACGRPVVSNKIRRINTQTCSPRCATAARRTTAGQPNPFPACNKGTKGAAGELIVCVDLLSKGWEVFRAVSPQCSCDLVAHRAGELVRVEVRTGYRNARGRVVASRKCDADVLAVVLEGFEVVYEVQSPATAFGEAA